MMASTRPRGRRREQIRRQAADPFAQGVTGRGRQRLEVSQKSAYVWQPVVPTRGVQRERLPSSIRQSVSSICSRTRDISLIIRTGVTYPPRRATWHAVGEGLGSAVYVEAEVVGGWAAGRTVLSAVRSTGR